MEDWAEYKTDTHLDANSPTPLDALFVDPENDDFRLNEGSPAIDAGVDMGLPYDGDAPDIGAFES